MTDIDLLIGYPEGNFESLERFSSPHLLIPVIL